MTRWILGSWALIGLLSTGGCNLPRCGPGTKQVQDGNGNLTCVQADAVAPFDCTTDGGVRLVGGSCVAQITCGPNTVAQVTPDGSIVCVGSGTSGCVPACGTPQPNSVCINGQVRHLVDNSELAPGEKVHVAVYEPLSFLHDANALPLAETDTDCGYEFDNVPYPSSMLLVVAVSDAGKRGLATVTNQLTGSGAAVVAQQAYRVDSFALPKATVQGWSMAAGTDYAASGAVVVRYFADPAPAPTNLAADETEPVAGVTLTLDGAPADGAGGRALARYFGASMAMLGGAQTSTGPSGTAIVTAPVTGGFPTLSGTGGTAMGMPIKWELAPGGSTAEVVFVERLHPM